MRIAFFSDIHANMPAFEAMLSDMDQQQPDAVYCLGDLVGYHIWPNEVIAEIRKRRISTIAGNHDLKVNGLRTTAEDLQQPGKQYAYHIIETDARKYLQTLPELLKLEYQLNNDKLNLTLAHGSPRKIDEYVLIDTDEQYVLDMMTEANADILFVGHSHKPYHRVIQTQDNRYKHVINTGSVGKPKDGDPRGCYVLVTINEHST
ncbi:MAG TPA: metallophosphoesterase family protein, partial [Niabella sp.]|nr:metallophosphoesterase family protein [Niabella sp.]